MAHGGMLKKAKPKPKKKTAKGKPREDINQTANGVMKEVMP